MGEPKFQVGQAVAGINRSLSFVVPVARVTRCKWRERGPMRVDGGAVAEMPAGWYYTLDTHPRSPIDRRRLYWVAERLLRPIDPNTEYTEEQERELCNG